MPVMEYICIWNICLPELSLSYEVCLNPVFWNSYFSNGSRACYWWSTGDFCLLVSLRCQVYYGPPITHMDKEQQGQRQDQGKIVTILHPDFRAALQDAGFMWDFEFILNTAIYLSKTNLSQTVFFGLLQNITMFFTCGLHQSFPLLLIAHETISA